MANENQQFYMREPAVRILGQELRDTMHQFKKDEADKKAPRYTLLPSGAAANRVVVFGTIGEIKKGEGDKPYYRGLVIDSAGDRVYLSAGQYQPDAMQQMAELFGKTGHYVTVIGKINIFVNPEGTRYVNIVVESIAEIEEDHYKIGVIDTVRQFDNRLLGRHDVVIPNYLTYHPNVNEGLYRQKMKVALASLIL